MLWIQTALRCARCDATSFCPDATVGGSSPHSPDTVVGGGCGSTALRSHTAGRCAVPGCPPSEQERGSERTAASGSLSQQVQFSWQELCGLVGAERRSDGFICSFNRFAAKPDDFI